VAWTEVASLCLSDEVLAEESTPSDHEDVRQRSPDASADSNPFPVEGFSKPVAFRRPMTRLLVTGGAGFIGSNFTRRAAEQGHEVVVLDKLTYAGNKENLRDLLDAKKIDFVKGDVCDRALADRLAKQAEPSCTSRPRPRGPVHSGSWGLRADGCLGTYSVLEARPTDASALSARSRTEYVPTTSVCRSPSFQNGPVHVGLGREVHDGLGLFRQAIREARSHTSPFTKSIFLASRRSRKFSLFPAYVSLSRTTTSWPAPRPAA